MFRYGLFVAPGVKDINGRNPLDFRDSKPIFSVMPSSQAKDLGSKWISESKSSSLAMGRIQEDGMVPGVFWLR